ncbi:type II secretion system protein J [Candidatus Dependentiae bacterium]
MKKFNGFTLIEVLIALSISTVIVFGMTQLYRNVVGFIDSSRKLMGVNKKVCLLFNQLENDISTAFIPSLHKEEQKKDTQYKKPVQQQKLKDDKSFFGKIYEDEYIRIDNKKFELFKSINFISTNPLVVYGENRPRIVRIKYFLERDKKKSRDDKNCYNLFRYETYELSNIDFKESEDVKHKEKKYQIKKYLVADYIKSLFVEYVTPKPQKEDQKKRNQEPEEIKSFIWNTEFIKKIEDQKEKEVVQKKKKVDKKEKKYVVPQYLEITIIFWNDELEREHSFSTLIPVWSYPTREKTEKKQDDKTKSDDKDKITEKETKNSTKNTKPQKSRLLPESLPVRGKK